MALLIGHAATIQVLRARGDSRGADALSQAAQGLGGLMEPAVPTPTLRGLLPTRRVPTWQGCRIRSQAPGGGTSPCQRGPVLWSGLARQVLLSRHPEVLACLLCSESPRQWLPSWARFPGERLPGSLCGDIWGSHGKLSTKVACAWSWGAVDGPL